MNTDITIKVIQTEESTTDILDSIESVYLEFERIVQKFTRFNESSELANLNRNSGNWVKVSEEFYTLIKYMINLAETTNGYFDPTIIDFLEIYGYDKNYDFSKLDNKELDKIVKERAETRPSFRDIKLNDLEHSVFLQKTQRLDLGGVGKGYAIDRSFDILSAKCKNFLIDAGGDIRVLGKNSKDLPWEIALKNQSNSRDEIIGVMNITQGAVASSGSWTRKFKQFHHLINPKTGVPENKFTTVYIQAPTGIEADSWATAVFIGGQEVLNLLPSDFSHFTI